MAITPPVAEWVTIPDLYRDPFPIFERLRAEGGVHWVPTVNRYLITSYAAVSATEHDQETFSANEQGSLQIRAMGHSMLRRDDPEHHVERRQWQTVLRPGAVKRVWAEIFERNAERYLEEFIAMGSGADLIRDFAAPYVSENLRQVLGFYNVEQSDLQRWSQTMIDATGNYAEDAEVWAKGKQSFDEVDDALDEMLYWHSKNPDNSLISSLLAMPEERMPVEKIRANMKMTIGGGLNEPRDAFGMAAFALLTHPEQRRAVAADASLWPTTFEETIRWVAPIGMYSRQTTRETELAGVALPAGARLGICVLSANRDTSVWSDAEAFDIRREVKPHLAFSKGVHVCLGTWIARAEVANVALPRVFSCLQGLALSNEQAPTVGGWVFRGMLSLPVQWESTISAAPQADSAGTSAASPRVAIVGSGPAGCFSAQALQRTLPAAKLEVFDRMPVPYGLVRYGVAADHQGTKSVSHQFDRLFQHGAVTFHGNTDIGRDITLDQLRANYDAVVLATGMHVDRKLNVPGANSPDVYGSGYLTRLLNSHPEETTVPALGETIVIVGQGNVAIDVLRLLLQDDEGLVGSDVNDAAHGTMTRNLRTVHVVGRSAVPDAKFDPVMVRELADIRGVTHVVHGVDLEAVPDGRDARFDALRQLAIADRCADARVRVEWWFGWTPDAVKGNDAVDSIAFVGVDGEMCLAADAVVTAIGFEASVDCPIAAGAYPEGRVEPGLYVAGWLRTGPRGTIPDQRTGSRTLARIMAEDVASGAVATTAGGIATGASTVDFEQWRRIDHHERSRAGENRARAKLWTYDELTAAAWDESVVAPALPVERSSGDTAGESVTILFGTESGNAELVADDLQHYLGGSSAVQVSDLANVSAGSLDASRIHIIICSTYGDGEVPTSARRFYAELEHDKPSLDGLRYGMFGMGDRSYDKTYSRGSELLDEALRTCGARRVGEYGRHDAGGSFEASEAAREWTDSVFAALAAAHSQGVAA